MIDGAIIQLLDPNKASEREQLLDYFLNAVDSQAYCTLNKLE